MKKIMAAITAFLMTSCSSSAGAVVKANNIYCIILAGGSGERLWPLSRVNMPKQLLSVGSDRSLLEQAIDRVANLVPRDNLYISTTSQHEHNIRQHVGTHVGGVIVEPGSRNTGPAILLCCLELHRKDPNAVVVFLPADPFIPSRERFSEFLEHAIDFVAHHDKIALLGLKPRYAATGYGYIEFDPKAHQFNSLYPVLKFHEKPNHEVAQKYVDSGTMLWNIGMFCGKAELFIQEYARHAPHMLESVQAYVGGKGSYNEVISDSIDYAVMEKSKNICVLPVDFSWCDVGNLEIFLSLKNEYGSPSAPVISVDSHNNLVEVNNKLVGLIGVDDLCVVDTGDTLLITKRAEAEKVKLIVKQLKEMKQQEYL